MAKLDTLFNFAGITVHQGPGGSPTRTKVRYGNDFVTRLKQLNSPKKIEDKRLGICMTPVRVQLVELPQPMLKMDALNFLLSHQDFQSPEDQLLIQDEIGSRAPKVPRQRKEKVVKIKTTKKSLPSLDSIKSRAKKHSVTAEAILAVVALPTE